MNETKENLELNNNEEEQRRGKKKLLLLLMLLLVTGIVLGTSTYAWFTANETVSVQEVKVQVAAQNGIQISADGSDWKSLVTTAELLGADTTYTAAKNQIPKSTDMIAPVSTVGNVDTDGLMEMFLGTVDSSTGENMLSAVQEVEEHGEQGNFVAFDLFFKVDTDTDIYFTEGTKVIAPDGDTGIKNASRMAFVILGHTDAGSSLETIQGLNEGSSAPVYIYEPNYDVHTATGVANAQDTYGLTTTVGTGKAQLSYDGIKADIPADTVTLRDLNGHATTHSNYFDTVEVAQQTAYGNSSTFQMGDWTSLSAGITKVRVYMWVEGQDVDCENGASGGSINYSIQITKNNS